MMLEIDEKASRGVKWGQFITWSSCFLKAADSRNGGGRDQAGTSAPVLKWTVHWALHFGCCHREIVFAQLYHLKDAAVHYTPCGPSNRLVTCCSLMLKVPPNSLTLKSWNDLGKWKTWITLTVYWLPLANTQDLPIAPIAKNLKSSPILLAFLHEGKLEWWQ